MISSVLVVCVANICRSPVGERLLAQACPDLRVQSAGISALVGHGADKDVISVAAQHGLSLEGHVSRQFTSEIAADFDLILTLEKGHMRVVAEQAPAVSGKTMLFGQWLGQADIADPYMKSHDFHVAVFEEIRDAAQAWAAKLGGK
ncbi:MAG: low molecular weight phosphotyrosine protein phosphatase [Paracoccaceae bacterium]